MTRIGIMDLPVELLAYILLIGSDAAHFEEIPYRELPTDASPEGRSRRPKSMADAVYTVCKPWKHVILHTPSLWETAIVIVTPPGEVDTFLVTDRQRAWLEESRHSDIDIYIYRQYRGDEWNSELWDTILPTLLPYSARWRTLHVRDANTHLMSILATHPNQIPILPVLQTALFRIGPPEPVTLSIHLSLKSPALDILGFYGMGVQWDKAMQDGLFSTLTQLDLCIPIGIFKPWELFSAVLPRLTNLRILGIGVPRRLKRSETRALVTHPINLPAILKLRLSTFTFEDMRSILQTLQVDNMETLLLVTRRNPLASYRMPEFTGPQLHYPNLYSLLPTMPSIWALEICRLIVAPDLHDVVFNLGIHNLDSAVTMPTVEWPELKSIVVNWYKRGRFPNYQNFLSHFSLPTLRCIKVSAADIETAVNPHPAVGPITYPSVISLDICSLRLGGGLVLPALTEIHLRDITFIPDTWRAWCDENSAMLNPITKFSIEMLKDTRASSHAFKHFTSLTQIGLNFYDLESASMLDCMSYPASEAHLHDFVPLPKMDSLTVVAIKKCFEEHIGWLNERVRRIVQERKEMGLPLRQVIVIPEPVEVDDIVWFKENVPEFGP